jgi:hypothetical protein
MNRLPDFTRVKPTEEENAAYARNHGGRRHASVYRLKCDWCGKRIWGSGLGIGSHRRACPRTFNGMVEAAKRKGIA